MASTRARRFPRQSEPEPQPEPDAESESKDDHGPDAQDAPKPTETAYHDTPKSGPATGGKHTTNANAEPDNTPRPLKRARLPLKSYVYQHDCKTLDEAGESGGTFWGIVRHAAMYRPRLVILENVKKAPWAKIAKHWEDIDFVAVHADVGTKAYCLPQTRERGYMFCADRRRMTEAGMREREVNTWKAVLEQFRRPASSLAGDDRRLEQVEKDMAVRSALAAANPRAAVNWDRYEVRHQSYRLQQGLGYQRPVSRSQDDGMCRMPDFAWQTWVKDLAERVWDTLDANFLRKLVDGYDMNYKERCLELSQGIDREIDSRAFGIVGYITPSGMPYITTRELQELAGNAMSSKIVGAAILTEPIVGYKVLPKGDPSRALTSRAPRRKALTPQGEKNLSLHGNAASSVRYCECEGQTKTRENILRCTLCLNGITLESYSELQSDAFIPTAVWTEIFESVARAFGEGLPFVDIRRSQT
ncbi:uncharacterized protein BDV14DRAFT_206001 [Aspergillus stella-maris]|uniref:uncharacterized protein n=1 Tax=Aspergillus stella-maris TaxID=1810926 RepID=UPI003CCCDD8C